MALKPVLLHKEKFRHRGRNGKKDLSQMPVQSNPCRTCPFEGEEPITLGRESYAKYVAKIVNLESQHLCHSASNKMLCRGGRNLLLRVMCSYGLIDSPTDAAFETAKLKALDENKEGNGHT